LPTTTTINDLRGDADRKNPDFDATQRLVEPTVDVVVRLNCSSAFVFLVLLLCFFLLGR
jgi:hypothetical protein